MAIGSKAMAKASGKAKGAAKALRGYPGIFHHLAGEHGEVSALMERVASSRDEPELREELFPQIRRSLLAHARAEEQEFYAPLLRHAETTDLVSRAKEEHREVEEYLRELASGDKRTESWLGIFERMRRAVQMHVDMEEKELFPMANQVLSHQEAERMQERYEDAEEQEKGRL